jgi:hypothetical protein
VERLTVLVAEEGDQLTGFVAFTPATGEIGALYAAHGYEPDGASATEPRSGLEEIRMWRNLPRNTRGRP